MTRPFSLSIFRFNAKTDYLPYYKKHTITPTSKETLEDLLAEAKAQDPLFDYPQGPHAAVKINGVALFTSTFLCDIKAHFGNTLTIDPLWAKRATKDLIIDTEDFYERFDLLAPYVQATDREYYESLVCLHYASQTLAYNPRFYGSALLVFAAAMMEKYYEFKEQILAVVANETDGVWFHTPLTHAVFPAPQGAEESIMALKEALSSKGIAGPLTPFKPANLAPLDTLKTLLETVGQGTLKECIEALETREPKHPFTDFSVAVFAGQRSDEELLERLVAFTKAKKISLTRSRFHSGVGLFPHEIAFKTGADILLEAFDAGCDFVVVEDASDFAFLETQQKQMSKACGRGVHIPILTPAQLALLALGELDKTALASHTVKPTFVD